MLHYRSFLYHASRGDNADVLNYLAVGGDVNHADEVILLPVPLTPMR